MPRRLLSNTTNRLSFVSTSNRLTSSLPVSRSKRRNWFSFDALILDDVEPSFFTRDQQTLIRQFVSRRGGGLLMLGGEEMFVGKQFSDSTLGELSPVYVQQSQNHSGPYTIGLTREGMLQPWLRLRDNASQETIRLRRMPNFKSVNEVGELKPGAYQFATVADSEGEPQPAVAVHRFGKGKVGAITVSDLWRWSMQRDLQNADDPPQAWRQVIRWLVGDVPRRTAINVKPSPEDPDRMEIRVDVVDEDYQPMENCLVEVSVVGPDEKPLVLQTKPIGEIPGAYSVSYYGDQPGGYTAVANVRSEDGALIGEPESGWTRQIAGSEFDQIGTNRSLLQMIAEKSGGFEIRERDLDQFSTRLESEKVPVTETWGLPVVAPRVGNHVGARLSLWRMGFETMGRSSMSRLLIVIALLACWSSARGDDVVVVVGADGEQEYGEAFAEWKSQWQSICDQARFSLTLIGPEKATEDQSDRSRLPGEAY